MGPDRLHCLDPLGHQAHAGPGIGAVVAHLLAIPACADAELETPAGEMIDRGDLLGGGDRVALHDQADAAADAEPRRRSGGGGEGDEQVVGVEVLRGELFAPGPGRLAAGRDVRVLGEEQRLVSAFLHQSCDRARAESVVGGK